MADKKISALNAASTPLAGTEVLPIVQGGNTVKVSVSNLTAGRTVSTGALTANGIFTASSGSGDIVLDGTGVANAKWRLLAQTGNTTKLFRIHDDQPDVDRLTIDGSGNVSIIAGNMAFSTAGKGIDFSANANAPGMTSELLTWYEEGTWTPVVSFGGGSTGVTYAVQEGHYTRIGRFVTGRFIVVLSSKGSSTGDALVAGLPFIVGSYNGGAFTTVCSNFASNAPTQGYCNLNTNQIVPWVISGTGVTGLTDANFNNNTRLDMWFQYFV